MPISTEHMEFISRYIHHETGIILDKNKSYLVEARLLPLIQQLDLEDIAALIDQMQSNPTLRISVIDSLTTNETFFFRELALFEEIKNSILPHFMQHRAQSKRLNIWCAACSSGQEPYSLAMLLLSSFPQLRHWQVRMIASDVSENVLAKAKSGRYNQIEINRGLTKAQQQRFFKYKSPDWEVVAELKNMVEFRKINLNHQFMNLPKMDMILLRNVLIYFNNEKKQEICRKIASQLCNDGLLFLSATESIAAGCDRFVQKRFGRVNGYALNQTFERSAL